VTCFPVGVALAICVTVFTGGCGESSESAPINPTASGGAGAEAGSSGGSAGGNEGGLRDGGDGGDLSPCALVCERYSSVCRTEQTCSSFCEIYRDGFPECLPEFDALFSCGAANTSFRFNCAQPFALQPTLCERQYQTLHYCDRTGGLECRPEPAFDRSCTVGVNPRPPHYTYCRLDATPPAGCVPYSTSSEYPLAYCCP
jgi:hypothetical protein